MTHEKGRDPEWTTSFVPFSVDLYDAVQTADGPFAVGGGGTVARKREGGWTALLEAGPSGQGSELRTIGVTDEGRRVWFAGASGALGMYDLREGEKQDYSYSGDATTSWREIAVTGEAGEERALLANGSGVVVSFDVEGTEITFSEPTEPGQGDAVQALETTSEGVGYAVDDAGRAYRAVPEGWESFPPISAGTSLTDVYADTAGRILVSAVDGSLYKYEHDEESWTPINVARSAIQAVDVFQGHVVVLATGATFYARPLTEDLEWQRTEAKTGNNLLALTLGYPDVAVGKSGTIVERPRGQPPAEKEEAPADPAPPLDPCRVLTEEMVERLEGEELLTLVEKFGCASPFTEAVAERFELRHLVVKSHHHPIREVPPAVRTRIRESERYHLCCACCHDPVLKADCAGEPVEPEPEKRLLCEHCGHAEFYVCEGDCSVHVEGEQKHSTAPCCEGHEHHHGCGCHEDRHEHHDDGCCGGHHERDHHRSGCDCQH